MPQVKVRDVQQLAESNKEAVEINKKAIEVNRWMIYFVGSFSLMQLFLWFLK